MVFKCKMCGGDIAPIENTNTGKCIYCKSLMTLPNLDNEKIINLYNRANNLRLKNEFDKAQEVYEMILQIDNEQVEAHWGLVLCRYGVEYVDDPRTGLKIPTCHRTRFEPISSDIDFQFIKEKSYGEALALYTKEANQINNIQKRILDISSKEKPYDIFICYKETDKNNERTQDSVIAEDIYEKLTSLNYKVFFARVTLEDKIGEEYEPYIFSALTSAKVMIVVGTTTENLEAIWVKNEWSRYLELIKKDKSKVLIPVYSQMDAYKLPADFSMLQAVNIDKVGAIQDLVRGVKKIVTASKEQETSKLDEEIAKKVQDVLDDSRKLSENKYEITVIKEKLPAWYYIFVVIAVFIIVMIKAAGLYSESTISIVKTTSLLEIGRFGFDDISSSMVIVQGIIICLLCIFGLMKIINRKIYRIANYIIPLILSLEIVTIFMLLTRNQLPFFMYIIGIVSELVLFIVKPKWHIDASSKVILDKENKDKQLAKNKIIKEKFVEKDKSKFKFKHYALIASIIFIIYIVCFIIHINKPQSNERDESVIQVKVITDYINIRKYDSLVGIANKGEIYNVLGIDTWHNDCKNSIKIKTNNGIIGYICSEIKDEKYVEYLDFKGNKIDSSKSQLVIITEYINVRESKSYYSEKIGEVKRNEVYTILKKSDDWYKIETKDGKEGWIKSGDYNEKYVLVIS